VDPILSNIRQLLEQIKCEVRSIEAKLDNPNTGLVEIKSEIKKIEAKLSVAGLSEIKREIRNIEAILKKIQLALCIIEGGIFNPTFGLKAIKAEVSAIEAKLDSPTFGLSEIKAEVSTIEAKLDVALPEIKFEIINIENKLDSPTFGLSEIKAEVSELLAAQGRAINLTTGPFLKLASDTGVHLKALNYTNTTQSVTFFIHNLTPCITTITVVPFANITPCCMDATDVSLGINRINMEIAAQLSTTFGIFVYATTTSVLGTVKTEMFKSADWLPLRTICF
jgi:hypothetical protein